MMDAYKKNSVRTPAGLKCATWESQNRKGSRFRPPPSNQRRQKKTGQKYNKRFRVQIWFLSRRKLDFHINLTTCVARDVGGAVRVLSWCSQREKEERKNRAGERRRGRRQLRSDRRPTVKNGSRIKPPTYSHRLPDGDHVPYLARHLFFIVFLCVRVVCARGAFRGRNKYDVFHQGTKSRWCPVQEGGAFGGSSCSRWTSRRRRNKKEEEGNEEEGCDVWREGAAFFPELVEMDINVDHNLGELS